MPNWCHNKLTITGAEDAVERLVREVAAVDHGGTRKKEGRVAELLGEAGEEYPVNQPLDFERIKPFPEGLMDSEVPFAEEGEDKDAYKARQKAQAEKNERQFGFPGWYEWCLEEWGTKWNANFDGSFIAIGPADGAEPELGPKTPIVEPGQAFYAFDTAWSPPTPVIEALATKYPDVRIEFVWGELGCDTAAREVWEGGVQVEDVELSISEALTPEEMWI